MKFLKKNIFYILPKLSKIYNFTPLVQADVTVAPKSSIMRTEVSEMYSPIRTTLWCLGTTRPTFSAMATSQRDRPPNVWVQQPGRFK
jgi:hypothetical protein